MVLTNILTYSVGRVKNRRRNTTNQMMKINSGGNINYICMTHAHDRELVDLLRMTSERLSQFTNEMGDKQTCNIEMRHLYKRIYFNPGLGPPVTLVKRSQLVPPCNPERLKQKFLIPPRKVKECFQINQ
jgi:hypothetical protein